MNCPSITKNIIIWAEKNPRILPWDVYNDPYVVWATEIMLQQTTVIQATPYIHTFFRNFPNLDALAKADEKDVLNVWEGLGYYSRARNLHFTARYVHSELNGIFPKDYEGLLKLKGVGPYTAAAIASFCYEESVPVLDGNVIRVLSRYFCIQDAVNETSTMKLLRSMAAEVMGKNKPSEHNQAMMNFGATQCTPVKPKCDICILADHCGANNNSLVDQIPYKSKKIKKKKRYLEYLIFLSSKGLYIHRRESKDIWLHLWQFPLLESESFLKTSALKSNITTLLNDSDYKLEEGERIYKQQLTHQIIHARFHFIHLESSGRGLDSYTCVTAEELTEYPLARIIKSFLSNNDISLRR